MALFQQSPPTSQEHFRVLDILPAALETKSVNIRLREVRFNAVPVYSAISYTWDDQIPTVWIVCNDRFLAITKNCADIIHCCRRTDSIVTIWVDQICIDQSSITDKNHYVSRMDDIYEKAAEVLVWIPDLDEDTFLLLKGFGSDNPSSSLHNLSIWHGTSHVVQEAMRRGMKSLESKTWFRRMWTVQEAAIPKPENVHAIFKGERAPLFTVPDFMAGNYELWLLTAIRELVRMEPGTEAPLSDILRLTLGRQCKDPRDKISSLYGVFRRSVLNRRRKIIFDSPEELEQQQQHFANPTKMWKISDNEIGTEAQDGTVVKFKLEPRRYSPPLPPDYDKSVMEVYIDTTWWFLQHREWHIFFIGGMSDSERAETNPTIILPSWVPDLTRISGLRRTSYRPWHIHFTRTYSRFAEPRQSDFPDWPLHNHDKQSLEIVGRLADTVRVTSEEMPAFDSTPRQCEDRIEWLRELHESEYFNENDQYFKDVLYVMFAFLEQIRQQNGHAVSATTVARVLRFENEQIVRIFQICEEFLHMAGWDCGHAAARQQLYELPLGEAVQSQLPTSPEKLHKYEQWAGYEKEDRYDMWVKVIEELSSISRHTLFWTKDEHVGMSLGTPRKSDSLIALDVLDPALVLILRKAEDFSENYWHLVGGATIDVVEGAGQSAERAEEKPCQNVEGDWVRFKVI